MNNIKIGVPLQKLEDGYIYDYGKNIWNPYLEQCKIKIINYSNKKCFNIVHLRKYTTIAMNKNR